MNLKTRKVPSRIREIVMAQQKALAKESARNKKALLAIARKLQRDLEAQLRALDPARFSAQQTRVVLAQVQGVVTALSAEYGGAMSREMVAMSANAASIGRESLFAQIDWWAEHYEDSVRAISRVRPAARLLTPELLVLHSQERYGTEMISRMGRALAESTLSGESVIQTADRLQRRVDLSPHRAETIARTESSRAMHAVQQEDMEEMFPDTQDEWVKQLVASFDQRTGEDSKFVHGQTARMDKPFKDNAGRVFMLPPGRPNDREVVVHLPFDAPLED